MLKFFLILALVIASASFQTFAQNPEQKVKAEILDIPDLPVRLKEAVFDNLEHRADLDYSITNLTNDEIWSFEIAFYFIDSNRKSITKKFRQNVKDLCSWISRIVIC